MPTESTEPRPYDFVPISQSGDPMKPIGHKRFDLQKVHGRIALTLEVQTAVHVSTGVLVLGADLNVEPAVVQPMTQQIAKLIIPGSSLKGAIRAVFEAITKSPLKEKSKQSFSPAGRVFGAMGYQGLLRFTDAECDVSPEIGFMPALYQPGAKGNAHYYENADKEKPIGRKFYYHTESLASRKNFTGVDIQQAPKGALFTTCIQFKNLSQAELGTLLIALGQDRNNRFALKIGGGKPVGFGTVEVKISEVQLHNAQRYSSFTDPTDTITDIQNWQQSLIQASHETLIVSSQLKRLAQILRYPTNCRPPAGNY